MKTYHDGGNYHTIIKHASSEDLTFLDPLRGFLRALLLFACGGCTAPRIEVFNARGGHVYRGSCRRN
eukprot:1176356-Prorocentrum_minimum.AAC.1